MIAGEFELIRPKRPCHGFDRGVIDRSMTPLRYNSARCHVEKDRIRSAHRLTACHQPLENSTAVLAHLAVTQRCLDDLIHWPHHSPTQRTPHPRLTIRHGPVMELLMRSLVESLPPTMRLHFATDGSTRANQGTRSRKRRYSPTSPRTTLALSSPP